MYCVSSVKILISDPNPQPVILRCHWITSSRPGKLLPEEGLPFLIGNTSAWGGFTFLGRDCFCLREGLLFLAGNTSTWGGFTFPGRKYFCVRRVSGNTSAWGGFTFPGLEYFCLRRVSGNTSAWGGCTFPGREYFCLRSVYFSWPGLLLP